MTTQQWQTVEALFNSALEVTPAERGAWVWRASAGNPTLARAVLRMLEADASPGDEIRLAVRSAVKEWMGR
ncbi:MAG: hypothetical protein JNM66_23205 [Bryobacterales bacterium]|nr:hypothetical protein [Bryobacterales bacterium]